MSINKSRSIGSRVKSVAYALNGLKHLLRVEPNVLIHLLATMLVITTGFIRHLDKMEWVAIIIAIGLVWIAEGFNTCIELLCDPYTGNEYNKTVGLIKDIAAGVVLISSVVSAAIGIIIFFF